jgi:hypothetical protein
MWSNPSDSNDEQPPPYSAVAPQANQPERRIIPSSNANVWMSDLPPRYEHPPTYSRISQPYRPLLPRDEASNLPRFAARSERPNPLHGVTRVLASIQMAEKETFNAQVNNIAALWAVDTGHGQPVRTFCVLTFRRVFGEELGAALWKDVDSCGEDEGQMQHAAGARLAILGS